MQPEGNVSETIARIVEEQLVAKIWQFELRLYMLLAVAFCASLVPPLFMLYAKMQLVTQLRLDRAQRQQRHARRRVQSAGAEVLPDRKPSSARRDSSGSAGSSLHKRINTLASSASSKSHPLSSSEPSLRSAPPSETRNSLQQIVGLVQPLRDSFKRRVTSGSDKQAENQRFLSLEDPLPPCKQCLKRNFETQSLLQGASEGGVATDLEQHIAGQGGSDDGLNRDQRFFVSGQTSDVEVILALQHLRQNLLVPIKEDNAPAECNQTDVDRQSCEMSPSRNQ